MLDQFERDEIFQLMEGYFPFGFEMDRDGNVVRMGKSLKKIPSALVEGGALSEAVRLERPCIELCFDKLCDFGDQVFVLALNGQEVKLRGQVVRLRDSLLWLVTPTFVCSNQLAELGLTVSDFALHDLTLENLFLKQNQKIQLDDHRRMVVRLKKALTERNRLAKLEQNLAHDLESAGDVIIRFNDSGLILDVRCVSANLLPESPKLLIGSRIGDHFPGLQEFIGTHQSELGSTDGSLSFEFSPSSGCILDARIARTLEGHFLLLGRNVTDRRLMEKALEHKSTHDALTNLANRDLMSREAERTALLGLPFGLAFIDIDDFKQLNDTYGHQVADKVLCSLAERLDRMTRGDDLPARMGGDEFAVLLRTVRTESQAMQVAERIQQALCEPIKVGSRSITVSCSVGVAVFEDAGSVESLIKNADIAMYYAKTHGKNHVELFQKPMEAEFRSQQTMQDQIRAGIENGEIVPFYQTIFDLHRSETIGVEALARWQHPIRGMLTPMDFIPVAEKSDLILRIGEHILDMACREVARLNQSRDCNLSLHVNVSPRELTHDDFVDSMEHILRDAGLPPRQLCIEITERLFIEDFDLVAKTVNEIVDMGANFALDDFGTGYSSLHYLEQLPVQCIKLDGSYVQNLHPKSRRAKLIRGTVQLANSVGLKVVAEGVENLKQAELIERLGCHYGQGFLYSKAMQLPTLLDLVNAEFKDDSALELVTSP